MERPRCFRKCTLYHIEVCYFSSFPTCAVFFNSPKFNRPIISSVKVAQDHFARLRLLRRYILCTKWCHVNNVKKILTFITNFLRIILKRSGPIRYTNFLRIILKRSRSIGLYALCNLAVPHLIGFWASGNHMLYKKAGSVLTKVIRIHFAMVNVAQSVRNFLV